MVKEYWVWLVVEWPPEGGYPRLLCRGRRSRRGNGRRPSHKHVVRVAQGLSTRLVSGVSRPSGGVGWVI
jgi:hypothetical protein